MARINDEYDIGAAFEAIENELIASMIRNMESHKQEEIGEDKQWSMWQTEMLKSLEEYKSYKILIYVPKGSKGAYIERISRYPKQRELLLDKDTIFRVVSKKEKEIELQVIV